MNVTVTREEIDQTNELLELLRRWEPIRNAGNHYDGGAMAVHMTRLRDHQETHANSSWSTRVSHDRSSV